MVKKSKINKNWTLAKILKVPGAEKILEKHNLPCLSCPLAKIEMAKLKIGEVAKMYQLDLKALLKDLNKNLP